MRAVADERVPQTHPRRVPGGLPCTGVRDPVRRGRPEQVAVSDELSLYVVLGLVEICEPVTPYTLKQVAEISVLNFWSLPHSQIYAGCSRLTWWAVCKCSKNSASEPKPRL